MEVSVKFFDLQATRFIAVEYFTFYLGPGHIFVSGKLELNYTDLACYCNLYTSPHSPQ